MNDIALRPGSRVKVKRIPAWLLADLPSEEQVRLESQRGKTVTVVELMPRGYLWLTFSDGTEGFSLPAHDVQAVNDRNE